MSTAATVTTVNTFNTRPAFGAFEQWILPHRRALMAQAQRLTGNASDAEDLVQETLVRAYTRREQLQAVETAGAWLATMQRNLYINQYRRRSRGPLMGELTEEADRATAARRTPATESPEATVTRQMEHEALLRAVSALPATYREVLVLSDVEGLPYQEIADRMGMPVGTIRSRLSRARRRVQRSLYAWRSAAAAGAYQTN